jgi:hypothetical protein
MRDMEQGDDVEAAFYRILAALETLTNYNHVGLLVNAVKNYITAGRMAKTDFLKVTYFIGQCMSGGFVARMLPSLIYDKPWSSSRD